MEERQCWICFQSESETKGATWVSPCNCRGDLAYAHEQCLLLWIDEKQKGHAFRPVKCPQCLRDYVITYPAPAPLLRLAEVGNGVINIAFPYLAVSGVLYCGYISCATYGFYAILQLLGPEESEALLWDSPHLDWRMYLGLPLIPVSLVWARMDSFDSLLPFLPILILPSTSLRLTWPPSPSLILSLLPWARIFYKVARASLHSFLFGPSASSSTASSMSNLNLNLNLNLNTPLNPNQNNNPNTNNNNNPNNNNPNNNNNGPQVRHHRVDMTNPIRTIVGALLLPVLSSTTGSLFFGGLIRNTFHRNVLGGCLFIVVKDMISFLYTYFWRKRQSQRRIQSFPRDPTH